MNEDEVPNATLEFVKGESWRRAPGGTRKTWRRLVQNELKPHLKLPRMTFKKWEQDWFDICKETAADRHQWRGLVRDVVAGKGPHCLENP